MAQIVWLVLLLLKEVFGVDTSGLASLANTVFSVLGVQ